MSVRVKSGQATNLPPHIVEAPQVQCPKCGCWMPTLTTGHACTFAAELERRKHNRSCPPRRQS